VAEELVYGEISTGAQNDLEKATQIARAMVAQYGMSDKVGPLSLGQDDPNAIFTGPKISGATAEKIDEEVNRLLNEAHDQAERILIAHRDMLDKLSALLLVTETIDGEDLEAYTGGTKPIPDPEQLRQREEEKERGSAAAAAVAKEPEPEPSRTPQISMPPAPPMPTVD
jgi:cell division protease FtsH